MPNYKIARWSPEPDFNKSDVQTRFEWDPVLEQSIIVRSQDIQPYLDFNKRLYNNHAGDDGWLDKGKSWKRAASIPNVIVEQWLREGINLFDKNDWPAVRRKLNSLENLHLRTAPGQL